MFVQLQDPITREWMRVNARNGQIIGSRKEPYACPLFSEREKRKFRVRVTDSLDKPAEREIQKARG